MLDSRELDETRNRIMAHAMHVENGILNRGNYFLVAESMLVVAYSMLLASGSRSMEVIAVSRMIALFGLLLTVAWSYVTGRSCRYLRHIRGRALDILPEYRETLAGLPHNPVPTMMVLTYLVPGLTGVIWVVLLLIG
jgi:hypothetical protein